MAIIEAVLWDMDGVLVDSERLVKDIFCELMNEKGYMEDPDAVYRQSIGLNRKSIVELYSHYLPNEEAATEIFQTIGSIYRKRMVDELTLKPGVENALESVAELGLPQMVVTSTQEESAHLKLGLFSLLPFFEGMICGDHVEHGKPHPEPYLTACKRLGVEPRNALVIEDSPNGVQAGLAAGCAVVHVPDLVDTDPEWESEIYYAMDSLESFPEWFSAQRGGDWL